jgi:acetyltransferase-like isoleucine patch superfamily enzyme
VAAPIAIERNVWLGAGATVLQGVTIGSDAVVAAGAIVTRDVPPRTLVAGVPAQVLREISADEDNSGSPA